MKSALSKLASNRPTLYEEWPKPTNPDKSELNKVEDEDYGRISELKKLRLQMILAVNPLGIPSLAFCEAYKKMFGKPLEVEALGFKHLGEMIASLPKIFTVQDPDSTTALLFNEYPGDMILHDARLKLDFERPDLDVDEAPAGKNDLNDLIATAWLNKDEEFPPDVVLAGEQYTELILPLTSAHVQGTRGLHQAVIVGATHPGKIYINIKSESFDRIDRLSSEIHAYFKQSDYPIEAYSVPAEFIYQGFPCLVYQPRGNFWERVEIVGRSFAKFNRILVKTVDYGEEFAVNPSYLYLIPKEFFDIPKQGVAVSLMGLKPPASRWTIGAGKRIRCFSNCDYWLDCLLIDVKQTQLPETKRKPKSPNGSDSGMASCDSPAPPKSADEKGTTRKKEKSKRRSKISIDFEALICDRNDDEYDIYLDEILALETYARIDKDSEMEVTCLRQKMTAAMQNVPRPTNPLRMSEEKTL